jgi:hypothetical protein
MGRNDRSGVEEDGRLEHFADMDDAEGERPDRDDVHADADVLGIETTDEELLAIETSKAWAQCLSGSSGIAKDAVWSGVTALSDERDTVARNELWNGKSVDGLFGHGGTSCMLNKLALSQEPKRQGRTTEVTGRGLPKKHGRMSTRGGRDRSVLARALRQAISARQATPLPWQNNSDRPTTDERACFKTMGHGRSAAMGKAKRSRTRRSADVEPRMNNVMENIAGITSCAREALSGSPHRHVPMHVVSLPSGSKGAAHGQKYQRRLPRVLANPSLRLRVP